MQPSRNSRYSRLQMQHENTSPMELRWPTVRLKRHKWRLGDPRGAIETRVNARKVRQYFMDNFSPREVVSRNHCTKEGTAPCPVH